MRRSQITLRDGSTAEVFEHGMSLNIVALRGSVPQQWILDFKATLGVILCACYMHGSMCMCCGVHVPEGHSGWPAR